MKLKTGYLIGGIVSGIILLFSFIWTQPDGKLHITFCDVGQGDAAYVRFPDGRDMVVDGGPNDKILGCLGKHMPFWDRKIDIVLLSHPQKDHMQGLISVLDRYDVEYFVRSDVTNETEGYTRLMDIVGKKKIPQKFLSQGQTISVDETDLSFLWPNSDVLGASTSDVNDYSLVFALRYGSFDVLFTGDADTRVEKNYIDSQLADSTIEVLKVPHHGSKTGMTQAFVDWVKPSLAVISVGKNNYGHPTKEIMDMLQNANSKILTTLELGDISVISDGQNWQVVD